MKTLEKLRQYLSNTSPEEFNNHWKEVEGLGVTGPTINDYKSFLELQPKTIKKPKTSGSLADLSYASNHNRCYSLAA